MLELLLLLMLKHTVADYFMQYGWMLRDKARYLGFGGIAHSGWHGILTASVLYTLIRWEVFLLYGVYY